MLYPPIVLASASPRRAMLLRQIGVPIRIEPADVDETFPDDVSPEDGAEFVARKKAFAVAKRLDEAGDAVAVLGADTIVLLDGDVLEKPRDAADARRTLERLSGRTHRVVTGVALAWLGDAGRVDSWRETTHVTFRRLRDAEIEAYVRSGRPLDKAGAYGIQEDAAAFVTRIEGCYFNVVGLPLARLAERLAAFADESGEQR